MPYLTRLAQFILAWISAASGVRRKFPREAKVSSQSCDITNQFYGECRRHDHSRVVRKQKRSEWEKPPPLRKFYEFQCLITLFQL